jgi:hypothetical protein
VARDWTYTYLHHEPASEVDAANLLRAVREAGGHGAVEWWRHEGGCGAGDERERERAERRGGGHRAHGDADVEVGRKDVREGVRENGAEHEVVSSNCARARLRGSGGRGGCWSVARET